MDHDKAGRVFALLRVDDRRVSFHSRGSHQTAFRNAIAFAIPSVSLVAMFSGNNARILHCFDTKGLDDGG